MKQQTLRDKVKRRGGCSIDQSEIVDLQDEIGNMALGTLRSLWMELDEMQQRNFLFVVFRVMGTDAALNILNQTAVRDMAVAMIQGEKQALDDERENVEAQLRKVQEDQAKMTAAFSEYLELQRQNVLLRNDLDAAQFALDDLREELQAVREKLDHVRSLRDAVRMFGSALRMAEAWDD